MVYAHAWLDAPQQPAPPAPGKAVCIGRNYAAHIEELGNERPSEPVLFMKPRESFVTMRDPIALPQGVGECQHEIELALLIGAPLAKATPEQARAAVIGYGLALDLTLREVQSKLKDKGLPWERAKAFDGACPLAPFIPADRVAAPEALKFSLQINGQTRQEGDQALMLWGLWEALSAASQVFTLNPGDVFLTGSPAGVGPLNPGDQLTLSLGDIARFETRVTD
ncbi:fumarylacetoacetate hydrolase family protein [Magnetofaba australis]|uniref:Putative fumarylacetoacetate hydrolase family protein n=1 Tax=Magnetofaba australis IT-1 TaxID=1434232 RepID=A0A1Y2K561_9PROT|nr:fumarylacetoacetate hydrolase family protein [Magnetofaba australis]OSM04842.1 putative fumarylacetoacetate hydrolase family protein [Magnetofaba australis IT-1]